MTTRSCAGNANPTLELRIGSELNRNVFHNDETTPKARALHQLQSKFGSFLE
jgi:hypothetical protein